MGKRSKLLYLEISYYFKTLHEQEIKFEIESDANHGKEVINFTYQEVA
jgi:hypothetical protein